MLGEFSYFDSPQLMSILGYSTPPEQRIEPLRASCGSGYCDFPTFYTLGVCFSIQNITEHLNITRYNNMAGSYNATLPNGARLDPGGMRPPSLGVQSGTTSAGTGDQFDSIAFADQPDILATRFLDMFIIWRISDPTRVEDYPGKPAKISYFRAFEVLFHLCVKTVDIEVRNGQTSTNMTDSETRITATNATVDLPCQVAGDPVEEVVLLTTPDDVSIGFPSVALTRLHNYLGPVFNGVSITGIGGIHFGVFSETLTSLFWSSGGNDNMEEVVDQEKRHVEIITGVSRNVADILTNM